MKIDIDKNRELAEALQVMSVPSMMFFFGGQRLVFQDEKGNQQDRITGFDPNMDKVVMGVITQLKETPIEKNQP